jgi:GNAT superfamily N-acetyltransferase
LSGVTPYHAVLQYLHDFSESISRLPGAVHIDQENVCAVFTRRAMFNRFYDRWIPSRIAADDVARVAELCARRGSRAGWIVDQSKIDDGFERALERERFHLQSMWTGMWLPLTARTVAVHPSLKVERVSAESFDEWAALYARVENYSMAQQETFRDLFKAIGLGSSGWTHLIARSDGIAAGVASLYVTGDVAALDWVGTLPEMRGRGVATQLVSVLLAEAAERARTAVLTSTQIGKSVYEKLGFVSCSAIDAWRYEGELDA